MIKQYTPRLEELWFRRMLLGDAATMSYNHAWGGTIDFPESGWAEWFDRWVRNPGKERFYRYLRNERGEFVGEIAYHLDGGIYLADVIVYAGYRRRGCGGEGLRLLCRAARERGIWVLYDNIAADNPALSLFLSMGFAEAYRTQAYIMLKKELTDL